MCNLVAVSESLSDVETHGGMILVIANSNSKAP